MDNDKLPLHGIKVLELGHTVMGPTCGLILADLGADVIKVEPTGSGDDTRWLKGSGTGFFPYFNRNKRSLSIDLKSKRGVEILHGLVKTADVLIENFGHGTIDRLGLGYETCKDLNPGLIYCSLKGFMPGPYEKRPALDEVVQMMGGLAYMTGTAGKPLRAGASVTDILSGSYGAMGILSALYQRTTTGEGQLVQASLFESVAFLVGQHMAAAALSGEPLVPMPECSRTWSVYDLFSTNDNQHVFIGITSDRHWQRLCATFGFDDWADDTSLATNQKRIEARAWLLPELGRRFGRLSKPRLMALAEKAAIPFAPVNKPTDLFEDPQMNDSGSLAEVLSAHGKAVKLPKLPMRMNGKPFDLRLQPPGIGEDSRAVCQEAGLSESEIELLLHNGVIQVPGK